MHTLNLAFVAIHAKPSSQQNTYDGGIVLKLQPRFENLKCLAPQFMAPLQLNVDYTFGKGRPPGRAAPPRKSLYKNPSGAVTKGSATSRHNAVSDHRGMSSHVIARGPGFTVCTDQELSVASVLLYAFFKTCPHPQCGPYVYLLPAPCHNSCRYPHGVHQRSRICIFTAWLPMSPKRILSGG
jgi:hypothetical protein